MSYSTTTYEIAHHLWDAASDDEAWHFWVMRHFGGDGYVASQRAKASIAAIVARAFLPGNLLPRSERHYAVEVFSYGDDDMPLRFRVGPNLGAGFAYFRTEREARAFYDGIGPYVGRYVEYVKLYHDGNPTGGSGLRLLAETTDTGEGA